MVKRNNLNNRRDSDYTFMIAEQFEHYVYVCLWTVSKINTCTSHSLSYNRKAGSWNISHTCGYLESFQHYASLLSRSLSFHSGSPLCLHRNATFSSVGKPSPLSSSTRSTHTDEKADFPTTPQHWRKQHSRKKALKKAVEYFSCTSEWQIPTYRNKQGMVVHAQGIDTRPLPLSHRAWEQG